MVVVAATGTAREVVGRADRNTLNNPVFLEAKAGATEGAACASFASEGAAFGG